MAVRSIVFVLLLTIDRAAKLWAGANLPEAAENAAFPSLGLHYNEGIAFSLMKNFPRASLMTAILGIGVLGFLCARKASVRGLFGTVFLWAGAIGNLTDRLLYGHVVDWIYVGGYVNLADVWLCIGGAAIFAEIVCGAAVSKRP
ncbi:MAG: signal peptidase II [Synergistaceae bacterium]|jgi:signal peptidase II|nr:signal peptidase II [Synergistaceae bacterium]